MSLSDYLFHEEPGITLYCGDCREVLPLLEAEAGRQARLVLTDPPYGVTRNPWDDDALIGLAWPGIWCLAHPRAAVVIFGQGAFSARLIAGLGSHVYRYTLIWEKDRVTGFLNADKMPLRCHEDILVFSSEQPTYNSQTWSGAPEHGRGTGARINHNYGAIRNMASGVEGRTKKQPRSVLYFPKPHPPIHPNQKPPALFEWLIRTYTDEGDLVVDPFIGSGTALEAAKKLNRRAIGIEIEAKYCELTVKRLRQEVLSL